MKKKYIGMMLGALGLSFASQAMDPLDASPEAQFTRAMQCSKGSPEGLRLLRLAAEGGHPSAQNSLGFRYAYGIDVEEDALEAARFYGLAADQGDASAQNNLGWMYENGKGVKQDLAEAVRLYKCAAAQGLAFAQRHLGDLYFGDKVITQDLEAAFRYYSMAAFPETTVENRPGVTEDFKKRSQWFRVEAQFSLGGMYCFGVGVVQNFQNAEQFYQLAANQGHSGAATMLASLMESNKK